MTTYCTGMVRVPEEYFNSIGSIKKLNNGAEINVEKYVSYDSLSNTKYLFFKSEEISYTSLHHHYLSRIRNDNSDCVPLYLSQCVTTYDSKSIGNGRIYLKIPKYIVDQFTSQLRTQLVIFKSLDEKECLVLTVGIPNKEEFLEYIEHITTPSERDIAVTSVFHVY